MRQESNKELHWNEESVGSPGRGVQREKEHPKMVNVRKIQEIEDRGERFSPFGQMRDAIEGTALRWLPKCGPWANSIA